MLIILILEKLNSISQHIVIANLIVIKVWFLSKILLTCWLFKWAYMNKILTKALKTVENKLIHVIKFVFKLSYWDLNE